MNGDTDDDDDDEFGEIKRMSKRIQATDVAAQPLNATSSASSHSSATQRDTFNVRRFTKATT